MIEQVTRTLRCRETQIRQQQTELYYYVQSIASIRREDGA